VQPLPPSLQGLGPHRTEVCTKWKEIHGIIGCSCYPPEKLPGLKRWTSSPHSWGSWWTINGEIANSKPAGRTIFPSLTSLATFLVIKTAGVCNLKDSLMTLVICNQASNVFESYLISLKVYKLQEKRVISLEGKWKKVYTHSDVSNLLWLWQFLFLIWWMIRLLVKPLAKL